MTGCFPASAMVMELAAFMKSRSIKAHLEIVATIGQL